MTGVTAFSGMIPAMRKDLPRFCNHHLHRGSFHIAFCEFGSDGFRYEESPLPPTTTDLKRQQSASAATRELLREGSPKRRHQK